MRAKAFAVSLAAACSVLGLAGSAQAAPVSTASTGHLTASAAQARATSASLAPTCTDVDLKVGIFDRFPDVGWKNCLDIDL